LALQRIDLLSPIRNVETEYVVRALSGPVEIHFIVDRGRINPVEKVHELQIGQKLDSFFMASSSGDFDRTA
jgi:hypothetical protein